MQAYTKQGIGLIIERLRRGAEFRIISIIIDKRSKVISNAIDVLV